jgi:hypothetical protein
MRHTYPSRKHPAKWGILLHGTADIANTTINRAILASTAIVKPVLSSVSEAEIGALFHNCKKATIFCTRFHEMGYKQPATPIQTDNSTACGIANNSIKQQRSCAIDMHYRVCDWRQQGHFNIFWAPGTDNLANYLTKHFLA